MAVPDITGLSEAEIVTLIQTANARYYQVQEATKTTVEQKHASAAAAISTLTALLGPVNATAGVGSIRAVRKYDGPTMATNAALALPLAFQALEILTATTLDLAHVVANQS